MAERSQTSQIYDSSGIIDSTGSANAYVIRISEQVSAYHRGMVPIRFKANFGNSGSATANIVTELSPSGLGAVTMKKGGGASDLASGDIVSGGVYTLIYDGTFFQVLELNAPDPTGDPVAAEDVTFAPAGSIAATDVQAAIEELDSEKQPLDADLTAIAALTTTAAGRSALTITDPGADRVMAWDDSAGTVSPIALADITAEASPASGDFFLMYGAEGDLRKVDLDDMPSGGGGITPGTAQASTSGTAIDFTGLPAGITRITVIFDGVSLSGTNDFLVQIGDSGGIENASYVSGSGFISGTNTTSVANSTVGFIVRSGDGNRTFHGHMTITRVTGNSWVSSHSMGTVASGSVSGGGSKSLSAELDRVRVTVSGINTFDAGQVNIFYE
jgi:hypothetical protein